MLKLRKILLCNYIYYVLLIIIILVTIIRISIKQTIIYENKYYEITGTIQKINIDGNKLVLNISSKENLIGTYYFNTKKEKDNFNLLLGDKIKLKGEIISPNKPTNDNMFNYSDYLKHRGIFHLIKIDSIKRINKSNNIYYLFKNNLIKRMNNNPYLYTFILGDKSKLNSEVKSSYQSNGISHLFAISGLHMTLLSTIILTILKKVKVRETKRYLITSIFLILYLLLTGLSPSIIRGVLFFIIFSYNQIYYFYIKPINLFIIILGITLTINPFYIYEISFLYSFLISLALLLSINYLSKGNYLIRLFKVSTISFLVSIPITTYNFYEINILGIIYNLFFVPLVSLIVFPLSLLTVLIPELEPIFNISISILENTSMLLNNISIGKLVFMKLNIIIYIIYLIIIFIIIYFINKNKYKYVLILILILTIHYLLPTFTNNSYIKVLDVGQGDSLIIHNKRKNILIDTGGKEIYEESWQKKKNNYSIVKSITIPTLKSLGIKKLNYLIITHGDADHMGEAANLVKNYKVENVIFNCGKHNNLEKELIKVLKKKKIEYYSCIREITIGNEKLYFLQTTIYDNENDNSNVIYTEINGYKFMFMGDAGIEKEKDILEEYNISNIDVLKVGHHGSKTSTGKKFIKEIKPKYAIISVGKNNRYNHPNKGVLKRLKKIKIYRTDEDGSIILKINNNKLDIKTCSQ